LECASDTTVNNKGLKCVYDNKVDNKGTHSYLLLYTLVIINTFRSFIVYCCFINTFQSFIVYCDNKGLECVYDNTVDNKGLECAMTHAKIKNKLSNVYNISNATMPKLKTNCQ
jgi:hypothetical protein